jgi:hypothetical protein
MPGAYRVISGAMTNDKYQMENGKWKMLFFSVTAKAKIWE